MISTVSIVVPCYNESEVIAATHGELDRCLGASPDFNFEFIYVDDGSRDGTRHDFQSGRPFRTAAYEWRLEA